MWVYSLACLLLALFGTLQVSALKLVANYKFWDSASNQIIYDYSGNSNHGQYWYTTTFTDRGVEGNYNLGVYIRGMAMVSKPLEGYSDFSISFWGLGSNLNSYLSVIMIGDATYHRMVYVISDTDVKLSYYDNVNPCNYFNCPEIKTAILGWNLYTLRLYSNDIARRYLDLYNNLVSLRNYNSPGFASLLNIKSFSLGIPIIIYELWAHTGLSGINDLNNLIYNGCPTTPVEACLPLYDKYKNFQGDDCPTECTYGRLRLSCDISLSCIQIIKSECLFGLYHIDTGKCLFYTPEDSTVCSTSTFYIQNQPHSLFKCSCKQGFKKISDEPIGCVPESWTNYHKEGFIYLEEGYTLDSNGDCCICDEGYAATSTSPLVCQSVPYCLEYIQQDNKNKCKTFKAGYKLDSLGNCCICEEDYISISPLECVYMPNCLGYTQEDTSYICSQCIEGYQLDSNGKCLECSEGYEKISENPLVCAVKIENCYEYSLIENIWKCMTCQTGYRLSLSGLCDECQEGYSKINTNSSVCKATIEKCIEYSEDSQCLACEVGYKLDSHYKCSSCDSRYVRLSDDPLECAFEVLNCYSYIVYEGDWVCNKCKKWYQFDHKMRCSLCSEGYSSQSVEVLECLPNPDCEDDSGNCSNDGDDSSNTSDQQDQDEEDINKNGKENSEKIKLASTVIISAAIFSNSVSGIVSMNPSIFIFYLNTIQLLSLILDFNINLPYEIKQEQKAVKDLMKDLNILSYIRIESRNPSDYLSYILDDDEGFLPNIVYQLLILILMIIFNILFYFMKRYAKGKTQKIAERIFKFFRYTAYIQFILITYLDIAESALFKIINPKESSNSNIADYNLAVISMMLCFISPALLANFLMGKKAKINTEEFMSLYGYLVQDFKGNRLSVYFYVIFLARRLTVVASLRLLKEFPLAQVLCHIVLFRPFKEKVFNIVYMLIELAVSTCFITAGVLVEVDLEEEVLKWVILGCIYCSYLLHFFLGSYILIKIIYPKVKSYLFKSKPQEADGIITTTIK